MNNKSRFLNLIVAALLIPLFIGIYCPCAKAAVVQELVIEQAPCNGCCATLKLEASDCQAISNTQLALRTPEISSKVFSSYSDASAVGTSISYGRRKLTDSRLEANPPALYTPPLYLLNLVLRV